MLRKSLLLVWWVAIWSGLMTQPGFVSGHWLLWSPFALGGVLALILGRVP